MLLEYKLCHNWLKKLKYKVLLFVKARKIIFSKKKIKNLAVEKIINYMTVKSTESEIKLEFEHDYT